MSEPVQIRFEDLPPSFNVLGTRSNPWMLLREKQRWESIIVALLSGQEFTTMSVRKPGTKSDSPRAFFEVPVMRWGDLPARCDRIVVEGRCTFPTRHRHDQGNYRVILEKACGDALVQGGWLQDDDWQQYEFGGLGCAYEKGVRRTELLLMPMTVDPGVMALEGVA